MKLTRPALVAVVVAGVAAAGIVVADQTTAQEPPTVSTKGGVLPGDTACILRTAPGQLSAPQGSSAALFDGTAVATPDRAGAVTGPVLVRVPDASLSEAPMVASTSPAGQTWVECGAPTTASFVQLPDVGSAELVLANPDSSDAVVNLTLFGGDGQVLDSGARGIAVPRRSLKVVPLAALAPAGMPIGVQVRTSQGRILATTSLTAVAGGADQASGLEPGRSQVIAGVPAKATSVRVLVTNPTEEDITASLRVLGARGAFAPAGAEQVEVPAQSTVTVDVTQAVGGEQVALQVTGDRGQLAASAHVKIAKDALLIPAAPSGAELVATGPDGILQVVNPTGQPLPVTIGPDTNPTKVTIPAGATWTGTVKAGAQQVRGDGAVAAAISTTGGAMRRFHPIQTVDIAGPVQVDPTLR